MKKYYPHIAITFGVICFIGLVSYVFVLQKEAIELEQNAIVVKEIIPIELGAGIFQPFQGGSGTSSIPAQSATQQIDMILIGVLLVQI